MEPIESCSKTEQEQEILRSNARIPLEYSSYLLKISVESSAAVLAASSDRLRPHGAQVISFDFFLFTVIFWNI